MLIKGIKRVFMYCLGLWFVATGVTFSLKSALGISPVNSIPYVLSLLTSLDQGTWVTIIFCVFVLIQIIMLRKDFKIKNLLQVIFSFVFGWFVTLSNMLYTFPAPETYVMRLVFLAISIFFIALGLMCYLAADIVPQPAEGVTLAITHLAKIPQHQSKIIFDCTVVAIAAIISLIGFRSLQGLREGTILSAIFVGKVLGILRKHFSKYILRFLGTEPAPAKEEPQPVEAAEPTIAAENE